MPATEVDPRTARERVAAGAFLLDCREPAEWDEAHIGGALLIPLMEVPGRLAEVPADRDVYVYCRSGARSARAAAWLRANGRPRAVNVAGGIERWVADGLPLG